MLLVVSMSDLNIINLWIAFHGDVVAISSGSGCGRHTSIYIYIYAVLSLINMLAT